MQVKTSVILVGQAKGKERRKEKEIEVKPARRNKTQNVFFKRQS